MKTVGLITEYNPFHNGHLYHIEQAKKLTGADCVIVVMSGDFVQRGAPSVMDKYLRTTAAILCGVDFVFEIPVCYSTGSAEFFAEAGVRILDSLNVTDTICFGSECGNINILKEIADILIDEPDNYRSVLQSYLKEGNNYAKARSNAFKDLYPEYSDILETPNNILGIEYLKALKKIKSSIIPYTIKREGAAYHDILAQDALASATAIRKIITTPSVSEDYSLYVPAKIRDLYLCNQNNAFPICEDDFSEILYCKLYNDITEGVSLEKYAEVNNELSNRIAKLLPNFKGFSDYAMQLKNKSYTHSRICRCLTHIMLGITAAALEEYRQHGMILYNRLLGMRNSDTAVDLLNKIVHSSKTPLLTSVKQSSALNKEGAQMFKTDIFASDLYEHISSIKYTRNPKNEVTRKFLKL